MLPCHADAFLPESFQFSFSSRSKIGYKNSCFLSETKSSGAARGSGSGGVSDSDSFSDSDSLSDSDGSSDSLSVSVSGSDSYSLIRTESVLVDGLLIVKPFLSVMPSRFTCTVRLTQSSGTLTLHEYEVSSSEAISSFDSKSASSFVFDKAVTLTSYDVPSYFGLSFSASHMTSAPFEASISSSSVVFLFTLIKTGSVISLSSCVSS